MLRHMFIFGVVIPTVITIIVFIGFLFCWFKFNMAERMFKKPLGKKQDKKSQQFQQKQTIVKQASNPNRYSNDPSDFSSHDGDRHDSNHPGNSSSSTETLKSSQFLPKHFEGTEEVDMGEDVETALCISNNKQNDTIEGIANPNLCVSPTEPKPEDSNNDVFTQHTFHFESPDLSQYCGTMHDSDDNSDDENYSQFVPLSQALNDPKTRQFFEVTGSNDLQKSHFSEASSMKLLQDDKNQLIISM